MNRRNFLTVAAGASLSAPVIAATRSSTAAAAFVWREVEVRKSVGDKIAEREWERVFSVERGRQFELEHEGYHVQCCATLTRFHREQRSYWGTQWFISKEHELVRGDISGLRGVDEQIALAKSMAEATLRIIRSGCA